MIAENSRTFLALLLLGTCIGFFLFWGLAATIGGLIGVILGLAALGCAGCILRGEHVAGGGGAIAVAILGFYLFPGPDPASLGMLGTIATSALAGLITLVLYFWD